MTLGSVISKYRYNRKRQTATSNYDINLIVDRLEGYRKYQKQMWKEKRKQKEKEERKVVKKFRKQIQKKLYSKKAVANPYIQLYKRMTTLPDPKLLERYNNRNIYSFHEFRYATLPKSNHQLTAANAWNGLSKAWIGFKASRGAGESPQREILYASAVQKWSHLLDLPIPHFPDIGVSAEGFMNSLKLKTNFLGYDNEIVD